MTLLYVSIIVLAVVILIIVSFLTFLLYQQMLAHNEINKRLLALSSEAMLNIKITQEEVDKLISGFDRPTKEPTDEAFETPANAGFNPHGYKPEQDE